MKNQKLIVIAGLFCFALIIGVFWMGAQSPAKTEHPVEKRHDAFDVAAGDTNNEVLRTILAKQSKLESQNIRLTQENHALEEKHSGELHDALIKTKRDFERSLSKTRQWAGEKIREGLHQSAAQFKLDDDRHSKNSATYPINDMSDAGAPKMIVSAPDLSDGYSKEGAGSASHKIYHDGEEFDGPHLPSDEKNGQHATDHSVSPQKKPKVIPFFTIPANSTLNTTKLMGSIIGEVPVGGHLLEPAFPFKAIVGKGNLFAANGFSIPPEISGMVISGYSVGNMTLSCARAYVTRILFVFSDGHTVVYPKHDHMMSATALYPHDALGYLSDPFGNSCIAGHYISDSKHVIANMVALKTAGGIGDAIADSQMTTMTNATQSTRLFTGSLGKFAAGKATGETTDAVLAWYMSRVSGIFDAVYIPASFHHRPTRLVFNVTKTIPIDWDQNGRSIRYENSLHQFAHVSRLD